MAFLQYKIKSEELETKTDVLVILPTPTVAEMRKMPGYGFYRDDKRYQVLYLYHGTTGDCWDWMRFSSIERYAEEHCLAVVMPNVQNSNFHNIRDSYAYENFVSSELPRIIEWTFPVSRRREDKFIAGLSMGGLGAFKIGMKNYGDYAAVACLSGAFCIPEWIEKDNLAPWAAAYAPGEKLLGTAEDPFWLAQEAAKIKENLPDLFLCCGTEDELCYADNQRFRSHLDSLGIQYTYDEGPGAHEWAFWDKEIQKIMNWLPLKNDMVPVIGKGGF